MRLYAALAAVAGWFALGLQFGLILGSEDGLSAAMHVTNYFSYFTILSNILVAAVLTAVAVGGGGFLQRPSVMTAAALYIVITGLTYTFILAGIWQPQGWALVADALLHYVMPVVYLVFWVVFTPKGTLTIRNIPPLLVFPVAYGVYSLVRGPIADWYPYPFLDVDQHGYGTVAFNIVLMTVGFAIVAGLLVLLDRWLGGVRSGAPRGAA